MNNIIGQVWTNKVHMYLDQVYINNTDETLQKLIDKLENRITELEKNVWESKFTLPSRTFNSPEENRDEFKEN